jgi:heme exporter protein A
MNQSPSLEARNLACRRGDALLFAGLELALSSGAALWVQGPNGVGKTSLLRILAGLAPAAAGEILWQGRLARASSPSYRSRLLYLGHTVPLKDDLSVDENLAELIAFDGLRVTQTQRAAAIDTVGLSARSGLAARFLSLGQRRRLVMARMLLARRSLWLLDEPAIGLDGPAIAQLQQCLATHLSEGGMAVFTSHQPLEVAGTVTRLGLQ